MKTLLIPFLMIAAVMTANAHCGTCGVGEAKAPAAKACCAKKAEAVKACAADCTKPCCAKKKAECSMEKAKSSMEKAECAKTANHKGSWGNN
jgi:hypothetical protein